MNQILVYLYDLFNMNFIIKDKKKYERIYMANFSDQLIFTNHKFRCIIIADKKLIDKTHSPFLSWFEKQIINFDKLLDHTYLSKEIIDEISLKTI